MSVEIPRGTIFDYHIGLVREQDPALVCPALIARKVLESIGVTTLSEAKATEFAKDLKKNNLFVITEEREIA